MGAKEGWNERARDESSAPSHPFATQLHATTDSPRRPTIRPARGPTKYASSLLTPSASQATELLKEGVVPLSRHVFRLHFAIDV
jgi:hypothetical protein